MVVDGSALLAVLLREPDRRVFARALVRAPSRRLSAAGYVETSIVIDGRLGEAATRALDRLLDRAGVEVVAVDRRQAEIARVAYRTYGKGRHPAALNFGDCFASALAKALDEPLLFKGDDFARTDIASALGTPD